VKKKKFYALLGVVCVVFASFAVVYAATWTPDQMADYMYNIGRHKIYQTNWILYNEIGPQVEEIFDSLTLDVQIQTLAYDTTIKDDGSAWNMYDTSVGGSDTQSDVYALVTYAGEPIDASIEIFIKDGGAHGWRTKTSYHLGSTGSGLYDVYIRPWDGLEAGTYLIEVQAYAWWILVPSGLSVELYGTATYTINCYATTT
jgi:hypothetical protein